MKITYFKSLGGTKDPFYCDPVRVFNRIRNGDSKDLVLKIRSETDKESRDKLKKKLNCILFSGEFSQRSRDHLLNHSGLIVLDIDDIKTKDILKIRKIVENDEYTYCCFLSPGGSGLKIVYKISDEEENHLPHFLEIESYLNIKLEKFTSAKKNEKKYKDGVKKIDEKQGEYLKVHIDKSGKDTSRVCFESYDPDIYYNEDSSVFEFMAVVSEKLEKKPIQDQNIIIERVSKWAEEKHNYFEGGRNRMLMILSSALCRFGVDQEHVINYVRVNYSDYDINDFTKEIAVHYRNNAAQFGTEEFVEHKYESKKERKKVNLNSKVTGFWYMSEKGKPIIDSKLLLAFIEAKGFYQVRFKVDQLSFVVVENMIVEVVDRVMIKHVVLDHVSKNAPDPVFNAMAESKYFSDTFLNALPVIDVKQIRDKEHESYIFFNNFYYSITSDLIQKKNYISLEGSHIWKSQVCQHDITEFVEYTDHYYYKFIKNTICGTEFSQNKMDSVMTGIGYIIHTYKIQSKAKMLYFCEEGMDEIEGKAAGGTGKGMLFEAIKYIRELAFIDGKGYNKSNQFGFSVVRPSTQVVVIDDYEGDINELFVKITGRFESTRKGIDTDSIPFEEAPKLAASSNFSPPKTSNSFNRRIHLTEFSDYYSKRNKWRPEIDFFSDKWTQDDWNCLYSFLFDCVKKYLANGLIEYKSENYIDKKIINSTSVHFFDFTEDNKYFLNIGEKILMIDVLEKYKIFHPGDRYMEVKDFKKYLKTFAECRGYIYKESSTGRNRRFWFELKS